MKKGRVKGYRSSGSATIPAFVAILSNTPRETPMSDTSASPPRSFLITSVIALIWNIIGIVTYLASVMLGDEALAAMPEAEQALYASTPVFVTAAYALAVHTGTLASIGLLLKKAWAAPVFIVSLICIIVQMGYSIFLTDLVATMGMGSVVGPLIITLVAVYLVWYSKDAKAKGWLK